MSFQLDPTNALTTTAVMEPTDGGDYHRAPDHVASGGNPAWNERREQD
ncbi:MAG: hypothetical protein AB9869_02085 [Verrucomicrobiia bacterium]